MVVGTHGNRLGGSTLGHRKSTLRFGLRQKYKPKNKISLTHVILISIIRPTITRCNYRIRVNRQVGMINPLISITTNLRVVRVWAPSG